MTVKEGLVRAVRERNGVAAGRIADRLRYLGMDYNGIFALARKWTGVDAPDWEALMYEADSEGV